MTRDNDYDPDATVRMPRPAVYREGDCLEQIDPDKTMVRDDWGATTILPHPYPSQPVASGDPELQIAPDERASNWDLETLRRPAHPIKREPR